MGRVIALDVGRKRIGVAVTDPLGITAQPDSVVDRAGGDRTVAELVDQFQATTLVVGLPRRTDGTEGPEAEAVRKFAAKLGELIEIPIELIDEWFTTAEAERSLIEGGASRARRREVIDAVAASLILQAWLAAQEGMQSEP